jgi:hypothetical protein
MIFFTPRVFPLGSEQPIYDNEEESSSPSKVYSATVMTPGFEADECHSDAYTSVKTGEE